MNKYTVTLALAAIFAVTSAPAFAALVIKHPTGGCTINCDPGEPANPGEPFDPNFPGKQPNPEGCMINCEDVGKLPDPDKPDEPGIPGKPGKPVVTAVAGGCGEKLGALRDVSPAQIQGVSEGDSIDIVSVCRSKTLTSEQEDVAELRPQIDQNPVLYGELGGEGYNANDVVGVVVNGRAVTLYVHRS